jgi:hypothetical protein
MSARVEYKVEEGIPLAKKITKTMYPFYRMNKGDSFMVPVEKGLTMKGAMHRFMRNNKAKFIAMEVSENGSDGIRCWRVK